MTISHCNPPLNGHDNLKCGASVELHSSTADGEVDKYNEDGRRPTLLTYNQLPEWHQDNPALRNGYRPISDSARISLRSWAYLHNETVNIYSHFIPGVFFLLGEWYILQYLSVKYPNITSTDYGIFTFFLLTAVICLALSTTYHTLMNHSNRVEKFCLKLDLVGIVVLTVGDFVSGIYVIFWCERLQRTIYWSMIGILGALTILVMTIPHFAGRKFRAFRALTFVALGASGFAPLIHGIVLFGWTQMVLQSGLPYYLAEGVFLLSGTAFYVIRVFLQTAACYPIRLTRFPESRYPDRFDIWGASHQIFHLMVVLATVCQLIAILLAFDYNYLHRTCSAV